ncbi:RHS repeat domain-containing protein [Paenibacillus pinihumi]|uniref:RHS repeat domain-containing protein n=1 Tax=Paenibacillus pinihumi TaxID=669462 RepID=UPI0012B62C1A|nr:RHS repeat-associated core domain-containing protein [Paenibacillus pinihumi]
MDELLQQINPEIEIQLGQLDYSASRFEDEKPIESPMVNVDPSTDGEYVEPTGELIIPDESLLTPSGKPDPSDKQMLMSNPYPTSYDEFAIKRLNIQRDNAPFSIHSINENISTISGSLSVQATDMVLPGRNGLSFALTRKYDSSDAQYYDKQLVSGNPYRVKYYPELTSRLYYKESQSNPVPPQMGNAGKFVFDQYGNYFSLIQLINRAETKVYYPMLNEPDVEFNNERSDALKAAWRYVDPDTMNSSYLLAKEVTLNGTPLIAKYYTTGNLVFDPIYFHQYQTYIVYGNETKVKQEEKRFPIGKGWSWDLPYIETKDNNKKYIHLFGGSAYELDGLQLKGYPWKDLTLESGYFNLGDNRYASHRLKTLDGKKMYFTSSGRLIEIADAYNNTLQFEYQYVHPYDMVLTKVKDAIGNELTITYSATEVVVTLGDRTVKFDKIKDPQGNKELLSQVTDAMGRKTQYTYDIKPVPFDIVGGGRMKDNYIALLKQVHHPTKARTDYSYADFDRSLGNSAKERAYRVTSREDVVTYTDGTVTKSNRADYSYNGDGAMVRPSNSSFSTTINNGRTQTTYHYDRVYIDENTPEVYYHTQVVNSSGAKQVIDSMEYNRTKRWPVPVKVISRTWQGSSQSATSIVTRNYNDYGNVTSETDPNNNTTTYTYDTQNLLSSSNVPVNTKSLHVELERYPGTNGIKTVTLKENNASGPLKAQTSYVYDSYGNPKTVTLKDDTRDIVITNEYDVALYQAAYPTRQSIQVTGADNLNTLVAQQFRYKLATGEMTSHTDGKGFVTLMEYDKLGRMTKATHPDQSSVSVLFDDNQNQVTATDETGVQSVVKWNPLGLKVSEGIVGKGATTYGYDVYGRLVRSDDATGKRTTYTYDAWDRLTRTQFPGTDNAFTTVLYDDIQRTVQTTDPEGNVTKETMDILGRPIKQEAINTSSALKSMTQYTYDYAGNVVTQKDAKGFTTTYAYDVLGRLITVTDPGANATNYVYSLAGNLKETKYPDNAKMTKQYDQMGRVIRKTDPTGGIESYFYDANSNLTKIVNRKGQARTYGYNNRDQQISSTTSQETITTGYDAAGRRLWMQDGTGKTQYNYEAGSGWLRSVTYPDTRKTEYEYDTQGKRTKMTDPFGVVSLYRYDARNQMDAVGSAANVWDAIYAYKKNGLVATADLRNGIRSTFGYDEFNLTLLTHTRAGSTLGTFAYQYDQNRNQTGKTESGAAYTFGYDSLNRIATSTQFNETYTYDVRGNRKTLATDAIPKLEEVNYTYDDRDRLTKVVTGANKTVTYRYNGDGLLTERTEAGVTTRYYYDGADIIAEGTVTGGTVSRKASYIRGNELVSRVDASGNRAYYSHNGHGDVTRLTDQAGNVLNSYTYDMWGNPITASETVPNLFRYSGEYWDETTGLQYLRARWYDPSIGRFINEDTYEGDNKNPLTLNLYVYVMNNPLIYVDSSGHIPTVMEAAKMAQHIYDPSNKEFKLSGGWKYVTMYESTDKSLRVGIYSRAKSDGLVEYSLVNRGTSSWGTLSDPSDEAVNNLQQPFGASKNMQDSISYASKFVENYSLHEVTMVGHSKGGAEAAANAVATNTNSILFNPMSVNLSAYDLKAKTYKAKMTAYIVKGELLNNIFGGMSTPIGEVKYLPTQIWIEINAPFGIKFRVPDMVGNHGMKAVIDALGKAGY